ncbi:MAG: zinc-regulated TonB-dependent outer membrane receptor, partial [Planctomycetes bacterium]|nr:zinc-regulated TonB-dependent outer membrane receptor [Planctomycetota bacterium]
MSIPVWADVPAQVEVESPTPSPTPTQDDEALLKELEKELNGDKKQAAAVAAVAPRSAARSGAMFNPLISLDGLFSVSAFTEPDPPEFGGHDPAGNGFTLQNLELTLSASVDPYLRATAHLIFSLEGVELEEAYFVTSSLPAGLQVKAGHFFTGFGRQNPLH